MGTPAHSVAYARFDTKENASKAFNAFKQWAKDANNNKEQDYCIYSILFDSEDNCVEYTVDSGKFENCEWQCEQIVQFFKQQNGCLSVDQPIMVCESSVNWQRDDDTP